MKDKLLEYLDKLADLLFSRRAQATAAVVLLILYRNQLHIDDETVKYLVATLIGWVVSDGLRVTEKRNAGG